MRIFAVRDQTLKCYPDDVEIPIDAFASSTSIPLVDCPSCGRGWGSSVRYPFFRPDKDGSPQLKRLWRQRREYDAIPRNPARFWKWLEEFRQAMAVECPRVTLIAPATDFGPLRLAVSRDVDVANVGCGSQLVARASIVDRFQGQGIQLQTCLTLLRPPRDRSSDEYLEVYSNDHRTKPPSEPYRELFAPPIARKAVSSHGELCSQCLRCDRDSDWTNPMPVLARSIPREVDLFRVFERPGAILATERFVEAIAALETWEMEWQAVEIDG